MAVLQVVAGDGFGMFFTLILAAIVYYMVSDHCANMSMYCLLVFGLISGFESLFGVLTLFSAVPPVAVVQCSGSAMAAVRYIRGVRNKLF